MSDAITWLRLRRVEVTALVAAAIDVGLLFDFYEWTGEQVAGANLLAVSVIAVLVGRANNATVPAPPG